MRRLLLLLLLPGLTAAALGAVATRSVPHANAAGSTATGAVFAVFFDWDQTSLSPHGEAVLAEASLAAANGHASRITLRAVDDSGAGAARRAALALARWDTVKTELRRHGIAADRIVRSGLSQATLQAGPIVVALGMGAASVR